MIEIVVGVLAVLVIAAVVWARVGANRSESRSVETYEHALDVLGEVSKRTESTGFRILPHDETGRPHVGRPVDEGGADAPASRPGTSRAGQGPLVPPRLPPAGPPKIRFSRPDRPGERWSAEDSVKARPGGEAAGQQRPATARARVPGGGQPGDRGGGAQSARRRRQVMTRRVATGGAAAVAVAAVVVAAISLSGGGGHLGARSTTTTVRHGASSTTTSTSTSTTTTLPTTLKPTSVTASLVSFNAPSKHYTLAFQATGGACWIGIKHPAETTWLFAETLAAGQSANFKGSGTLVVILGAPAYIGLRVNGLLAELPTGVTQAYSVQLTPVSG